MRGARPLRATCKQLRDVVARVAWRDRESVLGSRLRLWRACFPRAQAVGVWGDATFVPSANNAKDEDLQWVEGVLDVDLGGCTSITDAGLVGVGWTQGRGRELTTFAGHKLTFASWAAPPPRPFLHRCG